MSTVAKVRLWGTIIGYVSLEDGSGVARFEYDEGFVRSGIEVAPLMMPLGSRVYSFASLPTQSFHGLPGMLADSLPDKFGNAVIRAWLARQGRAETGLNAVERLCYTGSRGMGALEYEPALMPDASAEEVVNMRALVELADDILGRRAGFSVNEKDHAMAQIVKVGTSAGGARAKAVVAWNPDTGEIRSGQVDVGMGFEHWLAKFDGLSNNGDKEDADVLGYTRIEYAYYLMARAAGVEMSECRLFEDGGLSHFMTRRFDRVGQNGGKLHMQSLAALAHFDFNDPESYSYEQAAQVMRRLGLGQDEVAQLFRRMVFNVMARNHDDHVKNISFLMDKRGDWRLAPAYDVTYAFNPEGRWTSMHQMSVNGKRVGFTVDDLLAAARHMNIKAAHARAVVADVADALAGWLGFADSAKLDERAARAIAQAHLVLR